MTNRLHKRTVVPLSKELSDLIPLEICEHIISFLTHKPTLKSCSLTCRAWLETSWKTLFYESTLVIHRKNIHNILHVIERNAQSSQSKSISIIRYIEGLQLEQGGSMRLPVWTEEGDNEAFQFDAYLPRLVGFTSVKKLRLGWVRGDTTSLTTSALSANFGDQVTTLELNSVLLRTPVQFFEMLRALPRVRSLKLDGFKLNAGRPREDVREDPDGTLARTPRPPAELEELYCNVTEDIAEYLFSWLVFHAQAATAGGQVVEQVPIRILAVGLFSRSCNAVISRFLAASGSGVEVIKVWDAYVSTGFDLSPCTNLRTLRMGWVHLSSASPAGSETFVTDILKTVTSFVEEITIVLQILVSNTPGVESDLEAFDWAGLVTILQQQQFKNLRTFCFSVSSHADVVERALVRKMRPAVASGRLAFEPEKVFRVVLWSRTEYGGQW